MSDEVMRVMATMRSRSTHDGAGMAIVRVAGGATYFAEAKETASRLGRSGSVK